MNPDGGNYYDYSEKFDIPVEHLKTYQNNTFFVQPDNSVNGLVTDLPNN